MTEPKTFPVWMNFEVDCELLGRGISTTKPMMCFLYVGENLNLNFGWSWLWHKMLRKKAEPKLSIFLER